MMLCPVVVRVISEMLRTSAWCASVAERYTGGKGQMPQDARTNRTVMCAGECVQIIIEVAANYQILKHSNYDEKGEQEQQRTRISWRNHNLVAHDPINARNNLYGRCSLLRRHLERQVRVAYCLALHTKNKC